MKHKALIVSFSFEQVPHAFQVLDDAGIDWKLLPFESRRTWEQSDYEKYWIENAVDCDSLIIGADFQINESFLNAAKQLKYVSLNCAGMDHLDMAAIEQHQIRVRNVPRRNFNAVADLVFGQIICLMRKIWLGDQSIRSGKWNQSVECGAAVSGKTLGIIGTGAIGQAVARRASGFDMPVIALSNSRRSELTEKLGIRYEDHDEFFRKSDIIVLTCPLAENTRHIINRQSLSLMKPGSYLINPSRGGLIHDEALLDALRNNKIAGAALDAFEEEPLYSSPYFDLTNVLLTPHIGGLADREIENVAIQSSVNLAEMLELNTPNAGG